MDHEDKKQGGAIATTNKSRKQELLNKFLTKTYHMIDTCDPSIAAWSDKGDSFVVKDVDAFAKTVLPRFFKHSNFPSFARQLNFYSFRKLRCESSSGGGGGGGGRRGTKSLRFAHEFFRKGEPDLLHRIQRITKAQDACRGEVKSVRDEIGEAVDSMHKLSDRLDRQLKSMMESMEMDYQQRMASWSQSYLFLSTIVGQLSTPTHYQHQHPKKKEPTETYTNIEKYHEREAPSPQSVKDTSALETTSRGSVTPLMALSMIATLDREREFG
eukprot:Nitzschia sp. Nitz4//scaffold140_size61219//11946//12956//NITZ4_006433-RA/size61219-augustus-gene-0.61-mRNA-1//1//CDS//3329536206//118//frame0